MESGAPSLVADGATLVEAGRVAGWRRSPPTAAEWLALAVAVVLTLQYAWLLDDAFVYFRYVDNELFAQRGLTYNAGEYVEGFSSPLWMLMLLAVRAAGLDWWLAVRLLGVVACAAFWALLVLVGREASPAGGARFALPLLLLAPNYAVLCYFTSGVETPLVQAMAAVYALAVFRPGDRGLQLLAGLGPLARPELALPWLLLAGWCAWRIRRTPWVLLATALATSGGWLLFRVWYYADLLPSTFYLKYVRLIRQGVTYLFDTADPYGLHWLLGAAAAVFALLAWRDRRAARSGAERPPLLLGERAMLLLLAASVAAFVVKIGGDSRHYRYLAFPVCVAVAATAGLPEHLLARGRWRLPRVAPLAVALPLLAWAFTRYPHQLPRHPILATLGGEVAIPDQHDRSARGGPALINDAAAHRHHADLACPPWGRCDRLELRAAYRAAASAEWTPHRDLVVDYWCQGIYEQPEARAVHSLGLTDPFLARTEMHHERPGHKWGLVSLARDIGRIERAADNRPQVGMFRHAVEQGAAPRWVRANLDALELVERKAFNRHRFFENLQLALTFPEKIDPERR